MAPKHFYQAVGLFFVQRVLPGILLLFAIIWLAFFLSSCSHNSDRKKKNQDVLIAFVFYQVGRGCYIDYPSPNPLLITYKDELLSNPTTCENVIIGDSTMDIGRQKDFFYDRSKTQNYGIGGSTACDFHTAYEYVRCKNPKSVLIATSDGNGVLKGISPEVSQKTIASLVDKVRSGLNPSTIAVLGIHPVEVTAANSVKDKTNTLVSQIPNICYIDPLPIFGVGENAPPPEGTMDDSIHYGEIIYRRYKNILSAKCRIDL